MDDQDSDDHDPVPGYTSDDITLPDDHPDFISAFFAAINSRDAALITSLLDVNPSLVQIPDISAHGVLPLYAATVAGNPYIVALLAQRGAPIDELSPTGQYYDEHQPTLKVPVMRTPLMAAASQGSLPLVKLLFNDLRADDSVVAPDGAIALRLAILGNRTEIIALFPARRCGGWLRFKHSQRKGLRRIQDAGHGLYRVVRFLVLDLPMFFVWIIKVLLWDLPKTYLPPAGRGIWRAIKAIPHILFAMYKLMKRFVRWIWKGIVGIPRITIDISQTLWRVIKRIPSFCVKFLKGCWIVLKAISRAIVWVIKAVLRAMYKPMKRFVLWIWKGVAASPRFTMELAQSVSGVIKRIPSFFQTCFNGCWNTISRAIKSVLSVLFAVYQVVKWSVLLTWEYIILDVTIKLAQLLWALIKLLALLCMEILEECWAIVGIASTALVMFLTEWVWKLITHTIPQLLLAMAKFVIRKVVETGRFMLQLLADIASFFHTLITAIITRFKAVTLKDVVYAFYIVFVSIPIWIWKTVQDTAVAAKNGTFWVLKQLGDPVYYFVWVIWQVLMSIAKRIGQVAIGFGEIAAAGAREVVWWINPKSRWLVF